MQQLELFVNGVAGTLIVANTFVQRGLGYSSLQAGILSITYLVMVLIMIRVGEKLLQTLGCKKPMLIKNRSSYCRKYLPFH